MKHLIKAIVFVSLLPTLSFAHELPSSGASTLEELENYLGEDCISKIKTERADETFLEIKKNIHEQLCQSTDRLRECMAKIKETCSSREECVENSIQKERCSVVQMEEEATILEDDKQIRTKLKVAIDFCHDNQGKSAEDIFGYNRFLAYKEDEQEETCVEEYNGLYFRFMTS